MSVQRGCNTTSFFCLSLFETTILLLSNRRKEYEYHSHKKKMYEELKNKYKIMTHVVNLPCDIGDKIYVLTGEDKSEMTEDFVNVWEIRMDGVTGYGYETGPFTMDDLGETVFTKEEDAKYIKEFVERYKKTGGVTNES